MTMMMIMIELREHRRRSCSHAPSRVTVYHINTIRYDTVYLTCSNKLTCSHGTEKLKKEELSYRKQMACQLRTQYVEEIYRPKYYIVILKFRLRVTQGHCKRNHWIDNTRLSSNRII